MPPKVSLISDVTGDITIEGGSFTLNVQQTTIRSGLARHDFNNLRSVLDSANRKQNDHLEHMVDSRIQKHMLVTKNLDATYALLSRAQQLFKLLPITHRELVQQFTGTIRPHTATRSFGDNLVLVSAPLLSSSLFSTFSAEVQFMVFYFLVAMIFVDLFHPRLIHNRPSSRVSVLDALGKYHDFPWSACTNPMTFHAEFLRRFLNQTGFRFVKSGLYEVEYNDCIMKQNDWAAVKPFTDMFVTFVLVQEGGQSQSRIPVVMCPWCKMENRLPSVSGSERSTKCSCSECGRDFSAAPFSSSVEDGSHQYASPSELDNNISVEIRRFRIRLHEQSLHKRTYSHLDDEVDTFDRRASLIASPEETDFEDFRNEITVDGFVDETPTQPRKYITPPSTPKEAAFAYKPALPIAFGDISPLNEDEKQLIEQKRLKNTLAARKSRRRKLEQYQNMEKSCDEERELKQVWAERARMLLQTVRKLGINYPDFPENVSKFGQRQMPDLPQDLVLSSEETDFEDLRRNITVDSLFDTIQPGKYITPPATSNEAAFTHKPTLPAVFGDEDQLGDSDPLNKNERRLIEQKRRKNTLAARKSRRRKLEQYQNMEKSRDEEREFKQVWSERARMLLQTVRKLGTYYPDFPEDVLHYEHV